MTCLPALFLTVLVQQYLPLAILAQADQFESRVATREESCSNFLLWLSLCPLVLPALVTRSWTSTLGFLLSRYVLSAGSLWSDTCNSGTTCVVEPFSSIVPRSVTRSPVFLGLGSRRWLTKVVLGQT